MSSHRNQGKKHFPQETTKYTARRDIFENPPEPWKTTYKLHSRCAGNGAAIKPENTKVNLLEKM